MKEVKPDGYQRVVLLVLMVAITGTDCDITGGAVPRFQETLLCYQVDLWSELKTNWGQGLQPVWVGTS